MAKDYSEAAFLGFCDYAAEKGLWKKETARSRKSSSKRLLALLDSGEKGDLRQVDMDHLSERFANVEGTGFRPHSLSTYQSRLKVAVAEFVAWTDNPMNFKPSSSNRGSRRQTGASDRSKELPGRNQAQHKQQASPDVSTNSPDNGEPLVFPIPIRAGMVVSLVGVPADLSEAEAEKVAGVVRALAVKSMKKEEG